MQTTLLSVSIEWLLGIIIMLVFGSYGWTTLCYFWMIGRINELRDNHIAHLDERVEHLERLGVFDHGRQAFDKDRR